MSLGIRRELPKTRTKAVRLLYGCKRCKHFRTEQVSKRTSFYYGSYGRLESKVEYLTVEGAFLAARRAPLPSRSRDGLR